MKFRAGDVVRHKIDQTCEYVLACDERDGYAATAGWPDADVKCSEYEVTEAATDEQRLGMLRRVSEMRGDRGETSRRGRIALEQLSSPSPRSEDADASG